VSKYPREIEFRLTSSTLFKTKKELVPNEVYYLKMMLFFVKQLPFLYNKPIQTLNFKSFLVVRILEETSELFKANMKTESDKIFNFPMLPKLVGR
jgi:hypothetical protein